MGAAYKLGVDKFRKDNNREPTSEEKSALAVEAINDTEMMNGGLSAGAAPQLTQAVLAGWCLCTNATVYPCSHCYIILRLVKTVR